MCLKGGFTMKVPVSNCLFISFMHVFCIFQVVGILHFSALCFFLLLIYQFCHNIWLHNIVQLYWKKYTKLRNMGNSLKHLKKQGGGESKWTLNICSILQQTLGCCVCTLVYIWNFTNVTFFTRVLPVLGKYWYLNGIVNSP